MLEHVAVIGAAGKMGRGIALILLQEMAKQGASTGKLDNGKFTLTLVDAQEEQFLDLKHYLKTQMTRFAEKNIVQLRDYFAKNSALISNQEIIEAYVDGAMDILRFDTEPHSAKNAQIVFEAIVEDIETKKNLFTTLKKLCSPETIFCTNTSSIPIHILENEAQLNGRLIGFHFYNPPSVQKLVELIPSTNSSEEIKEQAIKLGKQLNKTLVFSHDIAGFIGNGHFIRELHFACSLVEQLTQKYSLTQSIYMINSMTQELLVRPMGIFQLADYVGLDVCQKIAKIMTDFIPKEKFNNMLIDELLKEGIRGGQDRDGWQKAGIFLYNKNVPTAIYSSKEKKYLPFQENNFAAECQKILGENPQTLPSWKKLVNENSRQEKLKAYFHQLAETKTFGAELAITFLKKSSEIAENLVNNGVCDKIEDVETVLKNGFYHLYEPKSFAMELAKK